MAQSSRPKVVLFDIGGVCVLSPFQAILDYELSLGIPPGWVNYSISQTAPDGFWHRLERGEIALDEGFYDGFRCDLHDAARWEAFYRIQQGKDSSLPRKVPPPPDIDGTWLFHQMMSKSRDADPWMLPALKALKASGQVMVGALSNTVIFPPGHEFHSPTVWPNNALRGIFDFFVSSAHVGLRKPDPRIYHHALEVANDFARQQRPGDDRAERLGWGSGIVASDILFLDDIGENLRTARNLGFRTIKVQLGRTYEAVEELEQMTGLKLEGDHPKIPIKPKISRPTTKL